MSQTGNRLRRGMLALAFAGSLGFGASQALAAPTPARFLACSSSGITFDPNCEYYCNQQGYDFGFCRYGQCVCRNFTAP